MNTTNSQPFQPMHVICFSWLLVMLAGCSSLDESSSEAATVQAKVEPSVVYLQFWTEAGTAPSEIAGFGTGFVVADSVNRNWIITTAHSLARTESGKRITCVRYRLPSQDRFVACGAAIVDEGHDLIMLQPHQKYPLAVPPLELYTEDQKIPTTLYALGSATALGLALFANEHVAEVITLEQWAQQRVLPVAFFQPLAADVTFLRHGIAIAPGYSGCPIVTADAKVVGVQSSHLKDAPSHGLAIHCKHIRDFDWTKRVTNLEMVNVTPANVDGDLVRTTASAVPFRVEKPQNPEVKATFLIAIKLAGVNVEAPLQHLGYVERDALTVIRKYVQDKEWYLQEQFGGARIQHLQQLLDRTRLARITNPLLGLQMLVPEGFMYGASPTENPDGLLITFTPPTERNVQKPYDFPLSVWVRVEPDLFRKARQSVAQMMGNGEIKLTEEERTQPERFALVRDRFMNAEVADSIIGKFTTDDLGIRVSIGNGEFRGNPGAEAYRQIFGGEGVWLRSNYISLTSSLTHLVRIGNREPVVVIVHYQFTGDDAVAFHQISGHPDPTFVDFAILASTISTQ